MPDLNSLPPSQTASRRQSQSIPATSTEPQSPSLNILPSNQGAVTQGSSSQQASSPQLTSTQPTQAQQLPVWMSNEGVGQGPGPARHPRAMTSAEMHAELEKEQEAVVNRLTRELSLLRAAQNASVVSNSSSTSAANSTHEPHETSLLSGSGFTIPTARRHNRTSSVTSNPAANLSSSLDARGSTHPANPRDRSMSRQNSSASRRSRGTSPVPGSLGPGGNSLDPIGYFQSQRHPPPSSLLTNPGSGGVTPGDQSQQLSPGLISGTSRYEEAAAHRAELDAVKRENEALKRKVRELERKVRERRASDASRSRDGRGRSDSVSTTASVAGATAGVAGMGIAGPREGQAFRADGAVPQRPDRSRSVTMQSGVSVGVGVPDEEVKVGESAASATNVSRD